MTAEILLCIVQLGDDLGLSTLSPWVDNMIPIEQILGMPKFRQDIASVDRLLHHPNRGAYTELQVLELLEMVHVSDDSIAGILKMDTMQPAELDTLLGILVNTEHIPGMLLVKAVQESRMPKELQPCPFGSACSRILHNIMMPDTGSEVDIQVPHAKFYLNMDYMQTQQDGEETH